MHPHTRSGSQSTHSRHTKPTHPPIYSRTHLPTHSLTHPPTFPPGPAGLPQPTAVHRKTSAPAQRRRRSCERSREHSHSGADTRVRPPANAIRFTRCVRGRCVHGEVVDDGCVHQVSPRVPPRRHTRSGTLASTQFDGARGRCAHCMERSLFHQAPSKVTHLPTC
jgi:hypothetical protein